MDTSNIIGEKILSITILWNQSLGMVLFTITATVPGVFEIFAHKQHATQPLIYFPNNYFIVIATFQRSKIIMMWFDGFVYLSSLQNNMPIRLLSHLMLKPRWNAITWKGEIYTIQFHSDYFLNCFNISCYCFSSSINFFIPSINYISLISSIVSIPFGLLLQLFQFHLACIYVW